MKLLAVGDMHLGRRPSRLPEELRARARELGPAGAWERLVEAAVKEQVDVVAFAGDLVEQEDDFFEAYRELHRGVARLAEAGIRVLGVAGNHDVQVLPRLADELPEFRLLGRDGRWEVAEFEAGGERLALWGWSFFGPKVKTSPLDGARFELRPGVNLGLLHCDLDQSGSPYAPVSGRELASAGLDGWLLGHVHKPDRLSIPSPSGYLGSVTGLDPGEPGARGPWLLEIESGSVLRAEQWLLAPLRWEPMSVDLSGITEAAQARTRLVQALRDLDETLFSSDWKLEAVGLRVTLTGRTNLGEAALELLSGEDPNLLLPGRSGTCFFVERWRALTGPEISMEQLAGRTDPAGLLARRLLLLDRPAGDDQRRALLQAARRALGPRDRHDNWAGLGLEELDDEAVALHLRMAGSRLLERMLAEQEAGQ